MGGRRASTGWRLLVVGATIAAVVMVPGPPPATGAPPAIPTCGPELTEVPLADANDLFAACTGSRLGPFLPPSIPSVALNQVVTVDWPAARCNDSTDIVQYVCVTKWDFELELYERGPGGEPLLLTTDVLNARGIHMDFSFPGAEQKCSQVMVGLPGGDRGKCELLITSDHPVPTDDLTVLMRVKARVSDCVDALFDGYCERVGFDGLGLPWWMGTTSLGGGGPVGDPPTAVIAQQPTSVAGEFRFDGSGSTANTDGASIIRYDWEFPDHTTATGIVATKRFTTAGSHEVTLTVTDSNGLTGTTSTSVATGLVVNSTADRPNAADSDTVCDTGLAVPDGDPPECTLRAAIEAANDSGVAQGITFDIDAVGTPVIEVGTGLPTGTVGLTIDGTSQPGGWVRLASAGGSTSFDGLRLGGAGSTVTGLNTAGFRFAIAVNGRNSLIQGNHLGTNPDGTAVGVQPSTGILVGDETGLRILDNVISASGFGVQAITHSAGTIRNNMIGVAAGGTQVLDPAPGVALNLRDVGVWSVVANTVRSSAFGIFLHGDSTAGTTITGNRVGTSSQGVVILPATGVGIFVDAVPAAQVVDNIVTVGPDTTISMDIAVTGSRQCDPACHAPTSEVLGPVTGTGVTVEGNIVGLLGDRSSPGTPGTMGIAVYAGAKDVQVTGNTSGGHTGEGSSQILLSNTDHATATGNFAGMNATGQAVVSPRAEIGIDVAGSANATIADNLVGGAVRYGIRIGRHERGSVVTESRTTVIRNNGVGLTNGNTPAANGTGISVQDGSRATHILGNTASGNSGAGVEISDRADGTDVVENRIGVGRPPALSAVPNDVGIEVSGHPVDTALGLNVIGSNRGAGIRSRAESFVDILSNRVGRTSSGTARPNGVGIDITGTGRVGLNVVWSNQSDGIRVGTGSKVLILGNSTYLNGGKGINAPDAPAAPTLAAVLGPGADARRLWFVIDGPPAAGGTAEIEIFANPDCTQPSEGRRLVKVRSNLSAGGTTAVHLPEDKALTGGFTATVTYLDAGPVADRGSTSQYSACVTPARYEDTSGTGIPDIVQRALGGDPAKPRTVTFPSDTGKMVRLVTDAGRFSAVAPVARDDVPAGLDLPAGLFTFSVTGLSQGQRADVDVHTSAPTLEYWRFGPPPAGGPATWYRMGYDADTGLGAEALSLPDGASYWRLHLKDGAAGDDDRTANGTIVDPGGPSLATGLPPAPMPIGATDDAGDLPRTGFETEPLTVAALNLLGFGVLLSIGTRRGRSRKVHPSRQG